MKGQRIPDRRSSNPQCPRSNGSFYMRFSKELLSCERNAREGMYGIIKEARYDGDWCCSSLNVREASLNFIALIDGEPV